MGFALVGLGGCASPSKANNKLREENDQLTQKVDALTRQLATDDATIKSLQDKKGALPTLPEDRLKKLFTVGGLKLGRLTGADSGESQSSADVGINVEATPIDTDGQSLKAAGSFVIELFDLAQSSNVRIGKWTFSVEQAKENWLGTGLMYAYLFKLPWQMPPAHADLTLKVTFHDELTGREFTQQRIIHARVQ